jgi:hypothetical protein
MNGEKSFMKQKITHSFGVEECISRVEDFMKIGDYVIDD